MKKLLFVSLLFVLTACPGEDKPKTATTQGVDVKAKFVSLKNNDQFIAGNDLIIKVQLKELDKVKNLELFLENQSVYSGKPKSDLHVTSINTDSVKVGFVNVKMVAEYEGEKNPVIDNRQIILFSNVVPETKSLKIVKKYPHDPTSYTQGLEFDGSQLWEGTGQRGQSKIAKINLTTGAIEAKTELEKILFGEGITILGDKIYQLTWQAGRCIVYDKNIMQKINEFTYSGEGWGLANNGKHLIMTDGSSKIVFRDPENFEIVKTIYAFDHSKEWNLLNEIEWIDGKIYANVYQRTDILVINPENGKVEQIIDAYDVDRELKMENPKSDVLNGIAYKKDAKEVYITGKNFPYLAKVAIVEDLP
ncbi:MAG: glutaminyl-peptide cyclotransferase [Crocinitomicaceae bacterium]|nr:glutaminyl-peptide cyclotransferase [Crocinitomicaceae bacterium]